MRISDWSSDVCSSDLIGRVSKRTVAAASTAPWHQQRQRPLFIGCSAAHVAVTAGTLGAFVRQRRTLTASILSNNHVLANENRAKEIGRASCRERGCQYV